ncbi:TetR/AcrR family transcriptional regulator [Kosakonia sacchari]|uniref:Transcriptional regulator, TetR family n=1 Tax=Kosakonia sacchari TaxID=1158459 RepID=A0A1G4XT98_9ENTR|nr:TetR/AcrR family transcriptional regulator [Kosakonia sacchari]AHJ73635.1 TetR family transcriptional regulator [Kosakonia sacchari SP1]SCX44436.1 transcriptional regulator, TetR family [Kosakonia sacchari]
MVVKRRAQTMEENRAKLIAAARKAFAEKGFTAASMDELTASVGLTRGALYHNFGDKQGLLAAVVAQVDGEMAQRAKMQAHATDNAWDALLAEGVAYIEMALDPEIQRIVLLDGPAFLGDPSRWPSQNACLQATRIAVADMVANGEMKEVDVESAARLLNGAALNAALWVAASNNPQQTLPKVIDAFSLLANGLRAEKKNPA